MKSKTFFVFIVLSIIFTIGATNYQSHKGSGCIWGIAYISTTTPTLIISSTTHWTDYLIKNYGPYDISIGSHNAITAPNSGLPYEGYRLEVDEKVSPEGKVYEGNVYGLGLTSGGTIYYIITTE